MVYHYLLDTMYILTGILISDQHKDQGNLVNKPPFYICSLKRRQEDVGYGAGNTSCGRRKTLTDIYEHRLYTIAICVVVCVQRNNTLLVKPVVKLYLQITKLSDK